MTPYQNADVSPSELGDPELARDHALEGESGEPAADQQQNEQQRDAAEDVDVADHEPADGREWLARQLPQDREDEAPGQGEDAAVDRELQRDQEPIQDEAELVAHEAEVEVVIEDEIHAGASPYATPARLEAPSASCGGRIRAGNKEEGAPGGAPPLSWLLRSATRRGRLAAYWPSAVENRLRRLRLEVLLVQVGERAVLGDRRERLVDAVVETRVVRRHREAVELLGRDLRGDLDAALLLDGVDSDGLVDDRRVDLAGGDRRDRVGALGEPADLGGVGLVVGVGLTGGRVLGADDLRRSGPRPMRCRSPRPRRAPAGTRSTDRRRQRPSRGPA